MGDKTAVRKLMASMDEVIESYAKMLSEISKGKTPKVIIDEKDMNMVLKMVDKIGNFELFDKIANGVIPTTTTTVTETTIETKTEEVNPYENPFESRSKVIKKRIDGTD